MSDRRPRRESAIGRMTRLLRREGKRVGVGVVGGVIVAVGIVLMPLPGPGMLIVLAGLAVLATQFAWAQDLLDRARARARDVFDRLRGGSDDDHDDGDGAAGDVAPPERGTFGDRSDVA